MAHPLFSLIIPMWNVAPYLPALWESLVCQNLEDCEILFIDDGSPDHSKTLIAERIEAWSKTHPQAPCPFSLHEQENRGVGLARNWGLAKASGIYLWFIDSDDMIAPTALADLRQAITQFPEADCFFFPFLQLHEENGTKIHQFYEINWERQPFYDIQLSTGVSSQNSDVLFLQQPAPWNKVYKKSFLCQNDAGEGARFAKNLWYEDLQFFANMLALKPRWVALSKPLYAYRLRPGSTMHNQLDPRNFDVHQILRNIEMFYYKMDVHHEFAHGLEALHAYHGYLALMTRLIQAGASHEDRNKLNRWMVQNCPNYAQNPLLSRKQKLLGFLYEWNLGWLVRFLK